VIYLGLPSPAAELAATVEGYRPDPFPATVETLGDDVGDQGGCLH
jgi:hypothetical protein